MFLILFLLFIVTPITLLFFYWLSFRPRFDFPKNACSIKNTTLKEKLFGQMGAILSEGGGAPQLRWMKEAVAVNKTVITYDFGQFRTVAPFHPADIACLLVGEGADALVKHEGYDTLIDMIGNGLVTIRDEKYHSEQRKLVSHAFRSSAINSMSNIVIPKYAVELDENLSKVAETGKPAQLGDLFDKFTLKIIVEAAFKNVTIEGIDVGAAFKKVQSVIGLSPIDFLPRFISKHIPTTRRKIVRANREMLNNATDKMTEIVQKQLDAGEVKEGTETLLDYIVRERSKMSSQQRADHLLTFMVAGHETTARAFQFLVMFLAKNPRVQDRLHEELCDVTSLHCQPSVDDLKDCRYLECVIKESLRLRPSAPIVGRNAIRDIELPHSKVVIPKGSRVSIILHCIHRFEEVWGKDAEEFRPERFEEEKTKAMLQKYPFAWTPFLAGSKRDCIGRHLAWNELLVGTATLVRSFKFEWPEGQEWPRTKWAVTQRPAVDPEIRVIARES